MFYMKWLVLSFANENAVCNVANFNLFHATGLFLYLWFFDDKVHLYLSK